VSTLTRDEARRIAANIATTERRRKQIERLPAGSAL
jgi:hypothetical protein